jgi:membrane protein DedA with SNARE-associated domain/rhodanese-related sulfurtransferase
VTTSSELTYGGVLLGIFAQQVGLPVPSIVFLMIAGSLSAHGKMSASIVVCLGIVGCLAGDGIWFSIGRKWGSKAMRVLCRFAADPRSCSAKARERFRRHGLPVLLVAKFLPGFDAVMPPLAGAEGVSTARFLSLDAFGSALWAAVYTGLGYVFANELELAIRLVRQFGSTLGLLIGVPAALYVGWRGLTLARTMRQLRLRRISPPMLARRLESDGKVAMIDLLNFEEADGQVFEAIPGAFRVEPRLLRKSPQISVPDDVKVILYCSSGSNSVSARAAVELKRIGIRKVWVLEGGLDAWREHGFPISRCSEAPEAIAERLGIKLPPRVAEAKTASRT